MHHSPRSCLLWGIFAFASLAFSSSDCEDQSVDTTITANNVTFYGHAAPEVEGVSEYLGIPFAAPPVGDLRFEPPVAYEGSFVNATEFGFECIQASRETNETESEDCLTLNVWAPQAGEAKKAIMVWVYGGAYTSGSSRNPTYNGQYIAEQGDIIVISFNYRLNIFGFPGNPNTTPNLGILDMRMAIEWIRENAEAFGGDLSRITLFGQSAGAGMIDFYSYAYAADPIASGFILHSATVDGFPPLSNETTVPRWERIAATVGCNLSNASDHTACMRGKSVQEIKAAFSAEDIGVGATPAFGPGTDNVVVFDDYTSRKSAAGGYLIGNNQNEAGLFRLFQPNRSDAYWQDFNDRLYTCADADRISGAIEEGNPAWRYRYFGDFANIAVSTDPPSGAYHGAELQPLFDTVPQDPSPSTPEEVAVGDYLRGGWIAFAKDTTEGLLSYAGGWPRYQPMEESLIRLAYKNQVGNNLATGSAYDGRCASLQAQQ